MPRNLSNAVVVITGPTSGIGRAAAHRFAAAGATVVLGARREDALQEVVHECEQRGGRALAVPTDVTIEEQVQRLARQAIEQFGRIDVWVNNAGVTMFARVEEGPIEAVRQVMDTNLFGCLYGVRTVLPIFREQAGGVLINVASAVATAPQPYTSAYVVSKAGIQALSDCVRMELSLDKARDIHVCTLLPASVDTPLFQHAANFTGRAVKALEPVYPADWAAAAIVRLATHPQRELHVGTAGRVAGAQHAMAPRMYEWSAARLVDWKHLQDRPADPTRGNLFEPRSDAYRISGGWQRDSRRASAMRLAVIGLGVALPLAVWALSRNGPSRLRWAGLLPRERDWRGRGADLFGRHGALRSLVVRAVGEAGEVRSRASHALGRDGTLRSLGSHASRVAGVLETAASRALGNEGRLRALASRALGGDSALRSIAYRSTSRPGRH